MLTSEFEILCPEFTILDVTLRDGGFSVNFHWKEEEVFTLLSTLTSNGVSHIELGYLGGLPDKHGVSAPGPASNVSISLIEKISHKFPSIKPILMIHPSASEISLPLRQYRDAGLYGVRVVYHKSWRENFLRLMEQVSKCEMFNCTNLALVSQYAEQHLLKEIEFLAALGPDVIYAADTCSALAPEHVKRIYKLLLSCCSVELGFHGHDFIGLGLANCLAAANNGARFLDGSLCGIGRSGGNVKTEDLLILKAKHGKQDVLNLEQLILCQNVFQPHKLASTADLVSKVSALANLTPPIEENLRKLSIAELPLALENILKESRLPTDFHRLLNTA